MNALTKSIVPVITIDGPTASGKGTVAHLVADVLGFHVLDSGALYRLTALELLQDNLDVENIEVLARVAANLNAQFPDSGAVHWRGKNVAEDLRQENVGNLASKIAAYPELRQALIARQRDFVEFPGLVADGRDMGTIIFPQAQLKVFLTASAEARAQRRYRQLIDKGFSASMSDCLHDLQARDLRDTNRAVAPLRPASDARVLDCSELNAEQVAEQVLAWYRM